MEVHLYAWIITVVVMVSILAIDVLIIYAIIAHGEELKAEQTPPSTNP